jgi:hypothetical protein
LHELGVQMIPAYSPQARGRSERSFSTWQGRLPQELRLHQIASLEPPIYFRGSTTWPSLAGDFRWQGPSGEARFCPADGGI